MKILHVLGGLDRGGVETWLVQMLRHIDRKAFVMDFLVHTAEPCAYDEEVRSLGSRIIPCLRPSNPFYYALNFRRILKTYGPYDCVHSHVHYFSGYVLALAASAGVPLRIAHSHNDTRSDPAGLVRSSYVAWMQMLIRGCASGGLAVSGEAGDDLFRWPWRNTARWKLLHLGIDFTRFDVPVDDGRLRRQLGIPGEAVVVGHVGRFTGQKNHAFLLEIFAELLRKEPRAFLLLAGDGPLRPGIEARISGSPLSPHVLSLGPRADVPALMKGAMDVFLFPSLYEGLPIALLEAQAAGLPCVVSDVISRESDVIAPLVARQSLGQPARAWADRVLRELSQPARLPLAEARQRLAGWSISASSDRLATLYREFPRA